jgi:hypothetical protein
MLFLHPAESYRLSEAARLIGVSPGVLRREAEADQREAYRSNGSWCFSWRQVACMALRRWTLAEIHDALGDDASTVCRRSWPYARSPFGCPSTSSARWRRWPRRMQRPSTTGYIMNSSISPEPLWSEWKRSCLAFGAHTSSPARSSTPRGADSPLRFQNIFRNSTGRASNRIPLRCPRSQSISCGCTATDSAASAMCCGVMPATARRRACVRASAR